MNFFGIGPLELALIIVLALVFLGPEELPRAARAIGKFFHQLQNITDPFREEFAQAMQPLEEIRQPPAQAGRRASAQLSPSPDAAQPPAQPTQPEEAA